MSAKNIIMAASGSGGPGEVWGKKFNHGNIRAMAYGAGRFVAFQDNDCVIGVSTDGLNWTPLPFRSSTFSAYGVVWNGTQFVAVGTNGVALISSDGLSWTQVALPSLDQMFSICWTGTQFVAVGNFGTVLLSPDGVNWSVQYAGVSVTMRSVASNGSTIVAVGNSGYIITSTDGINWTTRLSSGNQLNAVAWHSGSNQFIVAGSSIAIRTSPDGITWTSRTTSKTIYSINSSYASMILLVGQATNTYSTDGITFYSVTLPSVSPYYASAYGLVSGTTVWVAGGASAILAYSSTVSSGWADKTSGTTSSLNTILWNGSQFIALGGPSVGAGVALSSPNAETWTLQPSPPSRGINGCIWTGSQYVACGYGGHISTSPDGITWTTRTSNVTSTLYSIAWSGSRYVSVGNGPSTTSVDGVTWSSVTMPTTDILWDVAFGNGKFVAVGMGVVHTSTDGITWLQSTSGVPAVSLNTIIWAGSYFIAAGASGSTYTSTDGINWATQTGAPPNRQDIILVGSQFFSISASSVDIGTNPLSSWKNVSSIGGFSIAYNGTNKFVMVFSQGEIAVSPPPAIPLF
jgi:hypothetical protein